MVENFFATPTPEENTAAEALLPALEGYMTVEGESLTDYIGGLSEGAALLAGQPELAATAAKVDQIISCYQAVGAIKARLYSQSAAPLAAGVVAVADRNEIMDPINFFKCVVPAGSQTMGTESEVTLEPCSGSYTLTQDGNEFYILYAATSPDVCQAFCSNLEGCGFRQKQ